jgi:alpha-D-xyloside xylohydrolase
VKSGLRAGLIGYPAWGSDTGGYAGPPPSEELQARWLAFSAYSPIMSVLHGPRRSIWRAADPRLPEIARAHAAAHHDLIPYTRSCLCEARDSGLPVMRPLLLEFPEDRAAADLWDQYLYGPGLLVAPVLRAGAVARRVYLPAGRWLHLAADRVYTGPATVTVPAPLAEIPVFAREGAIIPRGRVFRGNDNWTPNWAPELRVEIYPGAAGGGSFRYAVGEEVPTRAEATAAFSWRAEGGEWRVAWEDPGIPGVLEIRCRDVRAVTRAGRPLTGDEARYDSARRVLRVPFRGAGELRLRARTLFD